MDIWQKSLVKNEHLKKTFYATPIYIGLNKMRVRKKVCHLTTVHSSFNIRIFHKQAKTLANAGYDVTLIAQHDKSETVDGVKIFALPKPKNRLHRMFGLTLKAFHLALKQKADFYNFHDPELIPLGVILKVLGKKVIYDVHEDYSKQILSKLYIPKIIRREIAFLIKTIEYFSSKIFDCTITATDDLLKNFSYSKKALSVRNFPQLTNFTDIKKLSDNKRYIFNLIYVGRLTEIRGITQIIKALESIDSNKQLKFILCGNFHPADYLAEIKSLEGFKKVEYLSFIEHKAIPELLRRCDAGIVCFLPEPNHINAMPNKIFEYMEAGLPVIASNFPLWKKIVEGNKCGVCVDPLKPEEIAKAIDYLIEQNELREEMGKYGRLAVLEKYNWENEAKKLLAVYKCIK